MKATKPPHQSHSNAQPAQNGVRVWDPLVRVFHWALVCSVTIAWISAGHRETLHTRAGYGTAGLILIRLVWGMIGTRHARFVDFIKSPRSILRYLRDIARGTEARYIGHNPAGGAMVVALILGLGGLAFTGWLMFTDAYYGEDWVAKLHGVIAYAVLALVTLHLCGVMVASWRHKENLVRAMITGKKRKPGAGDIS